MEVSEGVPLVKATLTCGSSGVDVCSVETKTSSYRSSAVSRAPSKTPADGRRCPVLLLNILPVTLGSTYMVTCRSKGLQPFGCCCFVCNRRFRTSGAYF